MTTDLRPTPADLRRDGGPPRAVAAAAVLLLLALLAGVLEALARAAAGPTDPVTALPGLLPRLVLYGVVGLVVWQLVRGRRWAVWVLLIGIGGIGTASLVVDPIIWLASGPDPGATLSGWGALEWVVAVARSLHLAAVLGAVAGLLRPATWRYVRPASKRPRQDSNLRHLL